MKKRINTKSKGRRAVSKLRTLLESKGFITDTVEKTGKFIKIKDLFSLFDLIAVKGQIHVYIQVTSTRPHVHKNYQKWANLHASEYVWIEQWVMIAYKGWKRFKYYPSGKKEVEVIPF